MFTTYFKTAFRSLLREKAYSLINIAGLSIGIACFLILSLYLLNETSYDRHHTNHERVYRLSNEFSINGNADFAALSSTQSGRMMHEQFDEILAFARFLPMPAPQWLMRSRGEDYYWENVYSANNAVFDLFTHEVIYGNPETVLIEPDSMAVSETFAQRYFGDANPIGEIIETENNDYRIDLVFRDLPENSHLKYDALLSYERVGDPDPSDALIQLWNIGLYTYLMFDEDYDIANFEQLSAQFFQNSMVPTARQYSLDANLNFVLEPLADIHLNSTTTYDLPRGNVFYVYAFAAIAVFVLLVASINYMNLATARATRRAKEVGMRKVIGASRLQLVGQFIGESVFYVLISLLIALLLTFLAINYTDIPQLFDSSLQFELLMSPTGIGLLILGSILIGLISGSYPAFYLSLISPQAAFQGADRVGKSGGRTRETLVLVQFIISVAVIASTLLMLVQMNFVQTLSLGFDKKNKIVVRVQGADQVERIPELRNELLQQSGVIGVTTASQMPGDLMDIPALRVDDNNGVLTDQVLNSMGVGFGFVETLGINVVLGRSFDESRETDRTHAVLVNESMVAAMGWDDPIGKRVLTFDLDAEPLLVIGVLEDFHYAGLQEEVVPILLSVFQPDLSEGTTEQRREFSLQLVVIVEDSGIRSTTDFLQQRWATFDLELPFEFRMLEDSLNELYGSEQRLMQLIGFFAGVCILISCLGLYVLSAFNTAQRTKEIGVRKVLGASATSIIQLLFRRVLVLVAMASMIASLVSYWAISEWLQNFYYRIDLLGLNLIMFAMASLLAVIIAFVTMALQSFKTAQSNPITALRHE